MQKAIPKNELRLIIKRFIADKNRGISVKLFADLCGVDYEHLRKVFVYDLYPITEWLQIRVSKGYQRWKAGDVAVMQNQDTSRFVEYRKQPKPMLKRSQKIEFKNGQIKINIGIRNRADYSYETLDEQLKRG